jgi:hypothetical protein
LINTVAPVLFLYGKQKMQPNLCQQALSLLDAIPPESNAIIKQWEALPTKITNASQSQALIHLKKLYCDGKLCLQCSVGLNILKGE